MADLLDSIEWRAVECLNANPAHGVENALKQVLSAACTPKGQLHVTGSQGSPNLDRKGDDIFAHCRRHTPAHFE